MGTSVQKGIEIEIIPDAEGAKQAMELFAAQYRLGMSRLIRAAHKLEIPYNKAFYLRPRDCHWVDSTKSYDLMIVRHPNDPVIEYIVQEVDPKNLADLRIWWQYLKKPDIIELLNFIRCCLDSLGVAISVETKLPCGFLLDSEFATDPVIKVTHRIEKVKCAKVYG